MGTVVNLEEFADLVGVTGETMRVHLRAVDGSPAWLIERGDRGRGYKIDAEGGVAWWIAKREGEEALTEERRMKLSQLRLDLVGDQVEPASQMALSGRQRKEEYGAVFEALRLRKEMGGLVDRAELEHQLTIAAVELRRRLKLVPGEFSILTGVPAETVKPLTTLIGRAVDDFLKAIGAPDAAD